MSEIAKTALSIQKFEKQNQEPSNIDTVQKNMAVLIKNYDEFMQNLDPENKEASSSLKSENCSKCTDSLKEFVNIVGTSDYQKMLNGDFEPTDNSSIDKMRMFQTFGKVCLLLIRVDR